MSYELTGQIKNTWKDEKWNRYTYAIKDLDSNITENYVYWGNNEGNLKDGLDSLYELNITYDKVTNKKDDKEYTNNTIKSVNYGEIITDPTAINNLLTLRIKFTQSFAKKVVDTYGKNTIRVLLREPEKLQEIKHRGLKKELNKLETFTKHQGKSEISFFLTSYGIKSKYHDDVIEYYDSDLANLKESMYDMSICCNVPFDQCDAMALKNSYRHDDPNRLKAFVIHMYKKSNQEGKLYLSYDQIRFLSSKYTKISTETALKHLVQIEYDNIKYYTMEAIYKAEKKIKEFCDILRKKKPAVAIDFDETSMEYGSTSLTDVAQRNAIGTAVRNTLSIISGGPGTGKTYTIAQFSEVILVGNVLIYILAPTGAATERVKSSNDLLTIKNQKAIRIKTIHSFIGVNKRSATYGCKKCGNDNICRCKHRDQPIANLIDKYDEIIFVIDEMSMVSMDLFYNFIKIIKCNMSKIRLILIGDHNQLPSIEGGNVLRDLIQYGKIKYTVLSVPHRQKVVSNIYTNGQLVLDGQNISPDGVEVQFIETDQDDCMETLLAVIKREEIGFHNSAIITPRKKQGLCSASMNIDLQKYYNKSGEQIPRPIRKVGNKVVQTKSNGDPLPKQVIRVGDKVIQTENDYNKDVYNGSVLVVDEIFDGGIKCRYYKDDNKLNSENFDYRIYSENEIDKLDLAYAITIHRAQGKGYDNVIIIMHSSMRRMLNKNLLYTAITRAKKKCIIIADKDSLSACKQDMAPRITNLCKDNMTKLNDIKIKL